MASKLIYRKMLCDSLESYTKLDISCVCCMLEYTQIDVLISTIITLYLSKPLIPRPEFLRALILKNPVF